jgi:hypothetical protein
MKSNKIKIYTIFVNYKVLYYAWGCCDCLLLLILTFLVVNLWQLASFCNAFVSGINSVRELNHVKTKINILNP